jgi:activator of 2-hydroxyglutaryl-CoA dehydratase
MTAIGLGIDVGSTTVKLAVVDPAGRLLAHRYVSGWRDARRSSRAGSRLP